MSKVTVYMGSKLGAFDIRIKMMSMDNQYGYAALVVSQTGYPHKWGEKPFQNYHILLEEKCDCCAVESFYGTTKMEKEGVDFINKFYPLLVEAYFEKKVFSSFYEMKEEMEKEAKKYSSVKELVDELCNKGYKAL